MKSPDYAKLLADYPLSQKIFADAGSDMEAQDAPLPDTNLEDPAPIVEPDMGMPGESEDEEQPLFDPEQIKESLRSQLAQWTKEDLKDEEGEGFSVLVDSLGDPDAAAQELKLGDEMPSDDPDYVEWVISQGNGLVKDLAEQCELPGTFEFELQEPEPSEAEPEEGAEPPPVEDPIPEITLVYKCSEADLDKLVEDGYSFAPEDSGEEEPSFDDIMSNLVQAGHEDVARRIYDILYPQRKH